MLHPVLGILHGTKSVAPLTAQREERKRKACMLLLCLRKLSRWLEANIDCLGRTVGISNRLVVKSVIFHQNQRRKRVTRAKHDVFYSPKYFSDLQQSCSAT